MPVTHGDAFCKCSMGYDYTGYGASSGELPGVGHTLSDVTAVYDYLVKVCMGGARCIPRNK